MRTLKHLTAGLAALALFFITLSATAQTGPTFQVEPSQGNPGSTVQLRGEGWTTSPDSIELHWGFQRQTMNAAPELVNGQLGGTAEIPAEAVGGETPIEICVLDTGNDDVETPDDTVCAETGFEVIPLVTVVPEGGVPGTAVTLSGTGFPASSQPRAWDVIWTAEGTVIGSATTGQDGTLQGSATVPFEVAEGPAVIEVCQFDVDLGNVCHPATPDFQVQLPTVTIDPPEGRPQGSLEVSGEGWCCAGATGTVLDDSTGEPWGAVEVGESGSLVGEATVPKEAQPGEVTLEVCVGDLCRSVVAVVLPADATTTTTTVTSTTIGPRPAGQCAVLSESLTVEPLSGEPGTALLVTVTGAPESPPGCRAGLQLAGEPVGEPFDLIAVTETVTAATVPAGIATGGSALDVVDLASGTVLASVTFNVEGDEFPWTPILATGLVLLLLLALIARPWRPRTPTVSARPEPTVEHVEPLQPVPSRWIEARLFARTDGVEVPVEYFRPNTTHRIEVRLGPTHHPAPKRPLTEKLRVVLTEPTLLSTPHTADLVLTGNEPSTSASFILTTDFATPSVDARLLLVNGTRVAQTAVLPSAVGPAPETATTDVARVETVVRDPALPPAGKGVASALIVDGAAAPIITQVGHQQTAVIRLSESGIDAMSKIRARLGEVVVAPEEFAGLDSEGTRNLLVVLAHHGKLLRSAIVDDFLGEHLAASNSFQVVSATPDAYLPFELVYDFVAPRLDAIICPKAGDSLRSSAMVVFCPGTHDESVVCPMGFWGMSKVIERHAFQAADDLPTGFLVRAQPFGERDRVPLSGGVLVAASDRVDAHHAGTVDHLVQWAAAASGTASRAESWANFDEGVARSRPAVLAMLPHTVHSDDFDTYGLEIGAADRRWAAQVDHRMIPDRPVIVALLGCETAVAGALSYERFPGLLRRAGAEIVIATLTEVLGRHAAPLTERLVALLYERCAGQPGRLGEVVLQLRRQLLAEGLPMVLALAVFGDADWVVGGQ